MALKKNSNQKKETVSKKPEGKNPGSEEQKMTSEEVSSAKKEDMVDIAVTERLNLAVALVSRTFHLDDTFKVSQFNDKGKSITLTLDNGDFSLVVSIKDAQRQGLVVE